MIWSKLKTKKQKTQDCPRFQVDRLRSEEHTSELQSQTLNNWTSIELPLVFRFHNEYPNNEHENDFVNGQRVNFERVVYASEIGNEKYMENDDLPLDLLRLVEQDERQILPHQEIMEAINLGTEEERKEVKIGTTLSLAIRKELIDLLQDYNDVFAWSYQDMPGLDTDIVVHRLPLREECMPVKQKLRKVKPEMLLKIKEEVKKQLDAGFLEVAKYSPMCGQHSASAEKRWQGANVCRLPGFEQSESQG